VPVVRKRRLASISGDDDGGDDNSQHGERERKGLRSIFALPLPSIPSTFDDDDLKEGSFSAV